MLFNKDAQYYKFCAYGFFKNLRFFDAFLLLYFIEKGLSYSQIGILYAFREIVINVFEILSGIIADALGRKKALVTSFVLYLLSFFMFYAFDRFWGFIIAFLFFGLADAFRTGTHKAMILAYLKKHNWLAAKTVYYGRTRSWSQKGSALSALIGAFLVFYTGDYSLIFLFSTVPYLIDLVLLSTYPNYLNGEVNTKGVSWLLHVKSYLLQLFSLFKQAAAIKPIVLSSHFTGFYKATRDYLQLIITQVALALPLFVDGSPKQNVAFYIGLVYFLLYLINALVTRKAYLVESWFSSSGGALKGLQVLAWIAGVVSGFCYVYDYYLLAMLLFGFIVVVQNIRRPITVKYVSDRFEDKLMASVLSVESQSETIFAAAIALLLGCLVEMYGLGWGIGILSVLLLCISAIVDSVRKNS